MKVCVHVSYHQEMVQVWVIVFYPDGTYEVEYHEHITYTGANRKINARRAHYTKHAYVTDTHVVPRIGPRLQLW